MMWALKNNERITATPKDKASCPLCNGEVIAKCGEIKIWHWIHKANKDCDNWWEPKTEWHIKWKNEFPKEQQEFTIGKHRADIRTKDRWIIELQNSSISSEDIIEREYYYKRMIWLLNGNELCRGLDLREKKGIITFRWKSPPKSWWFANKEIYIDLFGIVNYFKERIKDYSEGKSTHSTPIKEEVSYEYYTPEAEHIEVNYPTTEYIEDTELEVKRLKNKVQLFKDKIFLIKKIYHKIPCGGWGIILSKEEFLKKFNGGDIKEDGNINTIKEP